jgi:cysteine desulfurase / selenocysteine lyase
LILIDIDRIRADTPGVARLVYFDNAGAALMPVPVVEAMKRHIDLETEIGGYAAAELESGRLGSVYGSVARLVNAAPDEIALTENATVAWQRHSMLSNFRRAIAS